MFVYSLRASTLKFFGIVLLSVAMLVVLIALVPTYGAETAAAPLPTAFTNGESIKYNGIKTNDDRIAFLKQFGWEVKAEPEEEQAVKLPNEFDKVLTRYNELQKRQGLDLEKYRRREVKRYTYIVTNYPLYEGTVYANLLVFRGKVIGGDICSAESDGFIHGFSGDTRLP